MFQNIGEKIKTLAIACTIFGCLFSVVGAIICWCMEIVWAGFVVLIAGCLFSWIGSFALYGLGELIIQTTKVAKGIQNMQVLSVYQNSNEYSDITKDVIEDIQSEVISDYESEKEGDVEEFEAINIPQDDECPSCFSKISPDDKECPNCGHRLK